MTNKIKTDVSEETSSHLLSYGRVTAIIIAIEEYQPRLSGQIPDVDYAKADTDAFSATLD